jgi:E1A/CREB-binding protein
MIKSIVQLLQQRRPNASADWHQKLPTMAKRLEEALYRNAASFDEYFDAATLKSRLQQLAQSMGGKVNNAKPGVPGQLGAHNQSPRGGASSSAGVRPLGMGQVGAGMPMMQQSMPMNGIHPAQQQQFMHQQYMHHQHMLNQQMMMRMQSSGSGGINEPHDTAAAVASQYSSQMSGPVVDGGATPGLVGMVASGSAGGNGQAGGVMAGAAVDPEAARKQASEEHRRAVLKQQQQRLLLLRHASKCPHDAGMCPVTPHCSSMKQLWKHIMGCKDQECKVPHCVSSRYVLSHYSKCKDHVCPVCGPVRDAIKRNYEKSKQILDMSHVSRNGAGRNLGGMTREQLILRQRQQAAEAQAANTRKVAALDPVSCAIYTFTNEQIHSHITNMQEGMKVTASKIKELCIPLLDNMMKAPNGFIFSQPVDPIALNIPDYYEIVKIPMDLGSVKKRLEVGGYRDYKNFARDVQLVFDNAMLYNPRDCDVHKIANNFKRDFNRNFKQHMEIQDKQFKENRARGDACLCCGEITLLFEPPVFYCNGRCGGQRIRRNSWYYTGGTDQYHWCHQCFNEIKESTIRLPDCTLSRAEVAKNKKKHSEDSEESWVQCDQCNRWVHQICGLFNGRRNISETVPYICPDCLIKRREKNPEACLLSSRKMQARDLPHTTLSQFLEQRVEERLELAYEHQAKLEGLDSPEEAERCAAISIRQVSSVDRVHLVREGMYKRYKHKGYPAEFPVRTKCLVVFQNIDGQDVILFGLYVYEYGHKCPPPNQRKVYISYLDSVHYFRPKQYRTTVYQEIIVAYLEYVKARGFHTAHIWACPPLKGDDYILYCHPQDQKTPKDDRLRQWYDQILATCSERGICEHLSDLHTEYLADENNDATVLPYFDGDYWVSEAEVIIKELRSKEAKGSTGSLTSAAAEEEDDEGAKSKSKSKSKSKKRTRSAKAAVPTGKQERDAVMARLADMIKPMKEAFYVAHLRSREYAAEKAREREVEVENERVAGEADPESATKRARLTEEEALTDASDINGKGKKGSKKASSKAAGSSSGSSGNLAAASVAAAEAIEKAGEEQTKEESGDEGDSKEKGKGNETDQKESNDDVKPVKEEKDSKKKGSRKEEKDKKEEEKEKEKKEKMDIDSKESSDSKKNESADDKVDSKESGEGAKEAKEGDATATVNSTATSSSASTSDASAAASTSAGTASATDAAVKTEGGEPKQEGDAAANKEGGAAESKEAEPAPEKPREKLDLSTFKDDTEDVDDTQDNEHFDNRQAFLSLCQGNHYQFDQLRRAKHTSLMVLYHLHNPDAPKFVPRCTTCNKDILMGYRYRCEPCDIDICHSCLSNFGPKALHQHPLRAIAVGSAAAQQLTEEQRRDRNRSIQIHLQLLNHASECNGCKSRNCAKMKEFLRHGVDCKAGGVKKGCPHCKRIYNLLHLHARGCRKENCPVRKCREIREHHRLLNLRQQNMDDRRRAMMNQMYSQSSAPAASED